MTKQVTKSFVHGPELQQLFFRSPICSNIIEAMLIMLSRFLVTCSGDSVARELYLTFVCVCVCVCIQDNKRSLAFRTFFSFVSI